MPAPTDLWLINEQVQKKSDSFENTLEGQKINLFYVSMEIDVFYALYNREHDIGYG